MDNIQNTENTDNNTEVVAVEPEKKKRGHKAKKENTDIPQTPPILESGCPIDSLEARIKELTYHSQNYSQGLEKLRNWDGLLKAVTYHFDENGMIDWRKMINPKHVVLNRNSVARAGFDYNSLSDEQRNKFLEEWPDDKKVIRLAGFKEVAALRGYSSIKNEVQFYGDKVICTCTINWIDNFETCNDYQPGVSYAAVASASLGNVAPEYSHFLEAIASNRAFCRAVRESLRIHVVSDEELDPNKVEDVKSITSSSKPSAMLKKACEERGITFDTVLEGLRGKGHENSEWVSFETLPPSIAIAAAGILKE